MSPKKLIGKANVYIHEKGKSNARITHVDIELDGLNKIIEPGEASYVQGKEGGVFIGLKKEMNNMINVDGLCVRVGAMRCHSQAITVKMKKNLPLDEITGIIAGANEWVKVIPNNPEDTRKYLSPAAVSGTLTVPKKVLTRSSMRSERYAT